MAAIFTKLILFLTMIIMIIQAALGNLFGGNNPPEETTTVPSTTIIETTTSSPTETTTVPSEETTTRAPVTTTTTTTTTTEPVITETTTQKPTTTKKTTTTETGTRFDTAEQAAIDSFGGKMNDIFTDTVATSDGGFAACGNSTSTSGDFENIASSDWAVNFAFIVKYNSSMTVEWIKAIGFDKSQTSVNSISFEGITELSDGSLVAVGHSAADNVTLVKGTTDAVIYKFSSDGKQIFAKTIGGSEGDYFYSVDATPNGFVVGGETSSYDLDFEGLPETGSSAIIMNFDADGNILWNKYINGEKGGSVNGISADDDGNVFAACLTTSVSGNFAAFPELNKIYTNTVVIKYNYAGEYQWYFPIASSGRDTFESVAADGEGGCAVAGYYERVSGALPDGTLEGIHNCGGIDSLIFTINSDGTVKWIKILSGYYDDYITGIEKSAGGYAVCGYTYSSNREFYSINNRGEGDAYAAFITPAGNTAEIKTVGGKRSDVATCIAINEKGVAAIFGKTVSNDGSFSGLNTHLTDGYIELYRNIYEGSLPYTGFAVKYKTTIKK